MPDSKEQITFNEPTAEGDCVAGCASHLQKLAIARIAPTFFHVAASLSAKHVRHEVPSAVAFKLRNAGAAATLAQRFGFTHIRRATDRNKGTPNSAVTMPTGISMGANNPRARASQTHKSAAPPSADAGSKTRRSRAPKSRTM